MAQSCKVRYSRAKKLIGRMVKIAVDGGVIQRQADILLDNNSEVFDYAYTELIKIIYPGELDKRSGDLVCDSVYERAAKVLRAEN